MKTGRKIYLRTVLAWLSVCIAYNVWRLSTYVPNPIDGDFYAHNWRYQLIVFLVFRFPIWIVALLIVLCIEIVLLKRLADSSKSGGL
jgi:uncharacterized membrane protein YhaH (DUF805 family)